VGWIIPYSRQRVGAASVQGDQPSRELHSLRLSQPGHLDPSSAETRTLLEAAAMLGRLEATGQAGRGPERWQEYAESHMGHVSGNLLEGALRRFRTGVADTPVHVLPATEGLSCRQAVPPIGLSPKQVGSSPDERSSPPGASAESVLAGANLSGWSAPVLCRFAPKQARPESGLGAHFGEEPR
jgi:hypothetical protein